MSLAAESFYITAGTLKCGTPSYVVRDADDQIYQALVQGEYCYVLSSRQMGKSSLMIHTLGRLQAAGVTVAVLDLSALGFNVTVDQWYNSLLEKLGGGLNLLAEAEDYADVHERHSPLQRWMGMVRELALERIAGPIVVFIDEIDVVRKLPFSTDEFFAAIRACHNARAVDDAYQRLSFCLLGVATPADLIADVRLTPFNIGRRISLEDFTPNEATQLAAGLGCDAAANRQLLARILHWTDGHPCLTQRLCKAVGEEMATADISDVNACCARLFLMPRSELREDNLASVSHQLIDHPVGERADLLTLYGSVLAGRSVPDDETDPLVARLKLSGVVKARGDRLIVRNRIYGRVFHRDWVRKSLPDAEQRRQRIAYRRGAVRATAVAATVLAVVTCLTVTAVFQAQRANRYADRANRYAAEARSQAAKALDLLYISDMGLMPVAYERNDFRQMRHLLDETHDNPDSGYEWFYWQSKVHDDILTLRGHTGPVRDIVFFPGGKRIITSGEDGYVKLWDGRTGRELRALLTGMPIEWIGLSTDSRRLFTRTHDGISRLWDVESGRCLGSYATLGTAYPTGASLSDGTIAFSLLPGQWLVENRFRGKDVCSGVTPNGHRSLKKDRPNVVSLLDGQTLRRIRALDHGDIIYMARFSPDGRRIVTCSRDRNAKLWDAETGRLLQTLIGHQDAVIMAAFSPDSRRVVTVSRDRVGIIWDVATGHRLATLRGHEDEVNVVCFSPDGRTIATGSRDGTTKLWDATEQPNLNAWIAHATGLNAALFSHSGSRLVTCSDDRTAKVWDAATRRLCCTLVGHKGAINSACFSADDRKILTTGKDHMTRVWDASRGALLLSIDTGSPARSAAFSPDGNRIVLSGDGRNARVYTSTGQQLFWLRGHTNSINSVAYSPDGRWIATTSVDKTVRLWNAAMGQLLRTFSGHMDTVYTVAFSADGTRLVTGSKDQTARIWDVATGRTLSVIEGQNARVYSAVFSPDGRRVLTGSGAVAKLWDTISGRQLLALNGHRGDVYSVDFSPDGRRILTAGADRTVRIWSADSAKHDR
jgi:WD40 repeat protein